MAGRIREEDLEVVRERTDLAKVVSQYLSLKKAGHDSLVGLCPFHTEKSPSFSVSPSKQVYYCFGCGAGGDAVRFLQNVENLSFVETVERLAKEAGITLRYEQQTQAEKRAAGRRSALNRANEVAAKIYHDLLLDAAEAAQAREYLEQRGIDKAAAEEFGIGFAPNHPDFLLKAMSKETPSELLVEAGLATKDGQGAVRDRFRGRITFPVQDLAGKYVGFGARILPTDKKAGELPKYLNTAETPIYRKGELLYNLNHARGAITRPGEAYVVEGYTDVISMHQAGIENAVATCGTALGESHFRLLSRFAQRVVLSFDSDEAGARAAERAFAFQEQFPVKAVVMILPQGLDPADFVRERGADALRETAAGARPLVEFMLERAIDAQDRSTVEGQAAAVQAAMPILERLTDPVRRREYAHLAAERAGVAESSVLAALEASRQGRPVEITREVKRGSVQERVEREMLRLLARDRQVFAEFAPRCSPEHFRTPQLKKLFGVLVDGGGDVRAIVVAAGEDEKLVGQLSSLTVEPLEGDATMHYADAVWSRLQEFLLKHRSDDLRARLQRLNPTTDADYDELFGELVALDGELRRLRHRDDGAIVPVG